MPKPKKERTVNTVPSVVYFKPQGIPMSGLTVVTLAMEEYEALRLCDLDGLKHEDAARQMNISRPTFTRIIESARKKTAEAIVNGKAIRIEGGSFNLVCSRFTCSVCAHVWESKSGKSMVCPACGADTIINLSMPSHTRRCGKSARGCAPDSAPRD